MRARLLTWLLGDWAQSIAAVLRSLTDEELDATAHGMLAGYPERAT